LNLRSILFSFLKLVDRTRLETESSLLFTPNQLAYGFLYDTDFGVQSKDFRCCTLCI